MGLAALNPVPIDDANLRAIAVTLSHLSVALGQECVTLRRFDGPHAVGELERCREALGHVDAALSVLQRRTLPSSFNDPGAGLRPPPLGDPTRPYRAGATDPRLPLGRPHP